MILDFIQNLKSSVKIHLKPQWISSFKESQSFRVIPAGITCSKSTIEVLEQGMKYAQS